jgi:hypothetical protein
MISQIVKLLNAIYPAFSYFRDAAPDVLATPTPRHHALKADPLSKCDTTYSDGTTLSFYFDPVTQLVNYDVSVAQGSYLGFGYGMDMTDTNMVAWITKGDGNDGVV